MTSELSARLQQAFTRRMLDGLAVNNTLRGSWAEEVVGHYLGGDVQFSDQWSYYDMKWNGITVSVKHSVNPTARFSIARRRQGFDPALIGPNWKGPFSVEHPEGWRGHESLSTPQHWCAVYVYAWLPENSHNDQVLDPAAWRFCVLSRSDLYEHFPDAASKTVGQRSLAALAHGFVDGSLLAHTAGECVARTERHGTPALDLSTREEILARASAVDSGNSVAPLA